MAAAEMNQRTIVMVVLGLPIMILFATLATGRVASVSPADR